ncbi:MAG TPA: prepilin-type N-terminal cleavage/methylation domain-containing protein [Alphaproteobacteria bacterium]|nr:prepilin-type N-terminal cleavage/methylation domain-containing protein [Alphaproteobacteria bacterium]
MLKRLQGKQGFSLIEMAIVLLISGLLTAGAVQLMTNMQQQRTDQAAANEARNIITALERFMVDQQAVLTNAPSTLATVGVPVVLASNNMLLNFGGGNIPTLKYFEDNYLNIRSTEPANSELRLLARGYRIGLRNVGIVSGSSKPILRALVLRTPTNNMNESRLSRVASLIGSQGGLVRDNGAGVAEISGVQGSWRAISSDYGFVGGNAPTIGQIAVFSATIDSNMNTNVLSRTNTGNAEANTMRTNLDMGDNLTSANIIKNPAGIVMNATTAVLSDNCGAGTTISMVPNGFDGGGGYVLPLGPNVSRVNNGYFNMIVLGRSSGSSTNFMLLQCITISGNSTWQAALPTGVASTWRGFTPNAASCPGTANNNDFCEVNNRGYTISVSQPCNDSSANISIETVKGSGACLLGKSATCREISVYYRANGAASGSVYAEIPSGYSYYLARGCGGHLTWILE